MIIKCTNNDFATTLSLGREYNVIEEGPEYYVIIDNVGEEITCRKSRFEIIEDGDLTKKAKATLVELNHQLENNFSNIKDFTIRKNSKQEIKEIRIKFKYDTEI